MAERILLVGMMGSGKTTVGRLLADRLGWTYIDSDEQVESRTGRTVKEIFESDGEDAFRQEETEALRAALSSAVPAVVAVAGGAVLSHANRELLRERGTVVWLRAPVAVLVERVRDGDHRPLLGDDPATALTRLDAERRPLYAELADLVIDVAELDPPAAAAAIAAQCGDR